jgi:uncharacterized protein (TIGR00304 family)
MAKKVGTVLGHKTWLPVVLFAAGVALILAAVAAGTADMSLFILFPVFTGTSPLFVTGALLIVMSFFVGFALIMMGQLEALRHVPDMPQELEAEIHGGAIPESHKTKPDFAGLILIGPIPIAFGSDRSIAIFMLVVGVVLVMAFIIAAVFFH